VRPDLLLRGRFAVLVAPLLVATGAVAPKCVLCLLGYAGLAASLGWGGPELCGVAPENHGWLAIAGAAAGLVVAAVSDRRWRRSRRS